MSEQSKLEELARIFPDSTPEGLKELAEAIRKLENPTPEEEEQRRIDELRIGDALMRAHRRGGEEEGEPVQAFECRVCGCTEYTTHTKSNGIYGPGGRTLITGYECNGCLATFNDPAKFSKKKESP